MNVTSINTKLLINFADDIQQQEGFDECFEVLTTYIKKLHFDDILYAYVPLNIRKKPVIKLSTNYRQEYQLNYDDKHIISSDILISEKSAQSLLTWSQATLHIHDTKKCSDCNIISCRAFLSNNTYAGIRVLCNKDKPFFVEKCLPNIETLKIMTHFFYSKMESGNYHYQIFISPLIPHLNKTKVEVLQGLSNGLKPKQIADEVGLSVKYIQNLLGNIRQEFDCQTTEQLMYVTAHIDFDYVLTNISKNNM